MASFRGTVYVERVPGSPEESLANDTGSATRVFDVPWNARQVFARNVLGYSEIRTNQNGIKYIARRTPMQHPLYEWLYCTEIPRIEGVGFVGKDESIGVTVKANPDDPDSAPDQPKMPMPISEYETARMSCKFTMLTYNVLEDDQIINDPQQNGQFFADEGLLRRYVTKLISPMGEFITLPRELLHWADDPGPGEVIVATLGKLDPSLNLTYIHHLRPDLPIGNIRAAMGRVNSTEFDGYEPGTVLCLAPEIKPLRSPFGQRIYDIHFKFKYWPKVNLAGDATGHNYFLRYKNATKKLDYNLVTSDGTLAGNSPYPSAQLLGLFRPD